MNTTLICFDEWGTEVARVTFATLRQARAYAASRVRDIHDNVDHVEYVSAPMPDDNAGQPIIDPFHIDADCEVVYMGHMRTAARFPFDFTGPFSVL